jgi:hypothetical protein
VYKANCDEKMLGLKLFAVANNELDERLQRRHVTFGYEPEKIWLDAMIGVAQQVAKVDHSLPVDLRLLQLYIVRDAPCCLANNFESALNRETQHQVACQILRSFVCERALDCVDRSQDMRQSIGERWGHYSKDFNEVIGYTLSKEWLKPRTHRRLSPDPSRQAHGTLGVSENANKPKPLKPCVWINVDQHVEVAALMSIPAGARTEDREPCDALGTQNRGRLFEFGNDFVTGHSMSPI